MNWKEAKKEAKANSKDWRDLWKYGSIVRGVGMKDDINIDFGKDATTEQKSLLEDCIQSPNKWAKAVEELLDNPPTATEQSILKRLKYLKR